MQMLLVLVAEERYRLSPHPLNVCYRLRSFAWIGRDWADAGPNPGLATAL